MQEVEQRRSSCRGAEAFPADSGGVCRKRQFSLPLKQAYSGLQNFCGAHGTPQKLWRAQKHQSVSMVMVGELNWPSR